MTQADQLAKDPWIFGNTIHGLWNLFKCTKSLSFCQMVAARWVLKAFRKSPKLKRSRRRSMFEIKTNRMSFKY